jgi:predicted RNA binding protein YcfA (HicA-like mRNA interferase family)
MSQLPVLSSRKLIKALQKLGFRKVRQEGSHIFFKHSDGRATVIPFHRGRDIGKGLLRAILQDIRMTPGEFQRYL